MDSNFDQNLNRSVDELIKVLQTPIKGEPTIDVINYENAHKIIKGAIKAIVIQAKGNK